MKHNIVIFDFETIGYEAGESVNTELCDPIQIAAIPVNGKTLKVERDKAFVSMIKPTKGVDKVSKDSIEFHMKVRECTEEQVKETWSKAPALDVVWPMFVNYVKGYRIGSKSEWDLPISAGHNIARFDLPLARRINNTHGDGKGIFHPRDFIDTMSMAFLWMESDSRLYAYGLDALRDFLGISKKGGHDALKDCLDCSLLIKRFLKYQRYLTNRVDGEGNKVLDFKGSFKNWKDED